MLWTRRLFHLNAGIVTTKLHPRMAHAIFKLASQAAIILNNLMISTSSIPVVIDILGIECPLQACEALIILTLAWKVHSFYNM